MAHGFIWYELMTGDLDAALDFYAPVVGWTASDHPNSAATGSRYAILSAGEAGVAGAMQLTGEMCEAGAQPGWLGYVEVGDVDSATGGVARNGGSVRVPPTDIPGVGRFSLVADPGGAHFYLMAPLPQEDGTARLAMDAPGNVGWHELYAGRGQEAAFAWYAERFGWTTAELMDMGSMGKYRLFAAGGAPIGGMMDKPEPMPVSAWMFYFNVDAIDAAAQRIEAGGGTVLMGPHEVPGGGWIVQARDPQGAHFALVAPQR